VVIGDVGVGVALDNGSSEGNAGALGPGDRPCRRRSTDEG